MKHRIIISLLVTTLYGVVAQGAAQGTADPRCHVFPKDFFNNRIILGCVPGWAKLCKYVGNNADQNTSEIPAQEFESDMRCSAPHRLHVAIEEQPGGSIWSAKQYRCRWNYSLNFRRIPSRFPVRTEKDRFEIER